MQVMGKNHVHYPICDRFLSIFRPMGGVVSVSVF